MSWIKVATLDQVPEGEAMGITVGEREIGLFNIGGTIFATDNLCTHSEAFLSYGRLHGFEIECPRHQGRFDLRTGEAKCAPVSRPITVYPVKQEAGAIWVQIPD